MSQQVGQLQPGAVSGVRRLVFRTWQVVTTVLLIALCWAISVIALVAESIVGGDPDAIDLGWRAIIGFLLALWAGVMLIWRRSQPLLVALVTAVPPLLFICDSMACLIALGFLAASRPRWQHLLVGALIGYAANTMALWHDSRRAADIAVTQWLFGAGAHPEHVDIGIPALLTISAIVVAVPLAIGLFVSARRDLHRGAVQQRQMQTEIARREERTRIAREMHDVLGHRLSLLNLQAGALEVNPDPQQTAQMASLVRGTAGQALGDLRQVIGVLRDDHPMAGLSGSGEPGPGLSALPTLIDDARRSGVTVNVTVLLDRAGDAPDALEMTVYRLVQESLTNAVRHAPGNPVDVTVRGGPGVGLTVEVTNPIDRPMAGGPGRGVAGMTERVDALGGKISAGPADSRTFAVAAWLPWPEDSVGPGS